MEVEVLLPAVFTCGV